MKRGVRFEGKPILVAPTEAYDLWLAEFHDSEGQRTRIDVREAEVKAGAHKSEA